MQRRLNPHLLQHPSMMAERIEKHTRPLTALEVATLLRVSDQTIYRMVDECQIPFFRVRGSLRFDPQALGQWLRSNMIFPAEMTRSA